MNKYFVSLILLIIIMLNLPVYSQTNSKDLYLDGYSNGITLRQLEQNDFLILDIPFIEARIPLSSDALQFKYGGHLMWGLTSFFVDWTYAAGIRYFPFNKYLSFHATGHLGSFFLDNFTYMGAAGVNFDYKLKDDMSVSFGVEYFYRNSRDLLDYISFPNVNINSSSSPHSIESINIDSYGLGVSIALKF